MLVSNLLKAIVYSWVLKTRDLVGNNSNIEKGTYFPLSIYILFGFLVTNIINWLSHYGISGFSLYPHIPSPYPWNIGFAPVLIKLIFRDYIPNDHVNITHCWDIQTYTIWPSFFFSVFFPQGNNHCLKLSKQETNVSIINLSLNSDRTVSTCLNTSRRVFVFECFPSKIYLSHSLAWSGSMQSTP